MTVSDAVKLDVDTIFKITFDGEVDEIFKDFDANSFSIDVPYLEVNTFINGQK